jgi:hypothetical protein
MRSRALRCKISSLARFIYDALADRFRFLRQPALMDLVSQ